jgi:hypothetical protein
MDLFVANDSGTVNGKVGTGWKSGFLQCVIALKPVVMDENALRKLFMLHVKEVRDGFCAGSNGAERELE